MKKGIIKLITWIYVTKTKWYANRPHFIKAVKEAERKAATNAWGVKGKRTYVYFLGGKYRVVNRKQVQWWKNNGVIKRSLNLDKMKGICLYDTQGSVNTHPIYK